MSSLPAISITELAQPVVFAALFIWLLMDTQRKAEKREERLISIVDCYGTQLKNIALALDETRLQLAHQPCALAAEEAHSPARHKSNPPRLSEEPA